MRYFAFIFLTIGLTNCKEFIDYQIPIEQPTPVVYGHLNPEDAFKVKITKSKHILENDYNVYGFDPDEVRVYRNGQLEGVAESNLQDWSFVLPSVVPQWGDNFYIEIEKEGYDLISASADIPSNHTGIELINDFIKTGEYGKQKHHFILGITPSQTKAFFELTAYGYVSSYSWDNDLQQYVLLQDSSLQMIPLASGDPIINSHQIVGDNFTYNALLTFSNELFNQGTYDLDIDISRRYFDKDRDAYGASGKHITFKLKNISEAYYNHMKASHLQQSSKDDPLAEPVLIPSNVENALGLFEGYATDSIKVFVKNP